MTKKTRLFVFSSALVMTVGLCTGLLAYYGGLPTLASGRSAGPDELKYIPSSASIVAFANVREVMASDFRQNLHQIIPDQDRKTGQDKFKDATGIDVEQDIDRVVACVAAAGSAQNQGFVMLRGRFDNGRLESTAVSHGAKVEDFQGKRIVRVTHGDGASILAFVEPGLLMFGDETSVKHALSRQEDNVTTNDEMMGMIADVDEGNANLWAVGSVQTLAKNANLPAQIQSQIPGVKWFSASSRINGGLSGTLRAEAMDDTAAKNLREVVQGFLALAKIQAGSKPEMQPLLDSIQLSGTGKTVALSFQVPSEFIQAVSGKAKAAIE